MSSFEFFFWFFFLAKKHIDCRSGEVSVCESSSVVVRVVDSRVDFKDRAVLFFSYNISMFRFFAKVKITVSGGENHLPCFNFISYDMNVDSRFSSRISLFPFCFVLFCFFILLTFSSLIPSPM